MSNLRPSTNLLILSGEHPTLPLAEARAVLDAHKINYGIDKISYKLVRLNVHEDSGLSPIIPSRAAYLDETCYEIGSCQADLDTIERKVSSSNLNDTIGPSSTFSVRVSRFGGVSKNLDRTMLERDVGGLLAKMTGAKVDLIHPEKLFRGFLTEDSFHLGVSTYQRPAGNIASRRPRKRAVFHPSTMMPKLARCMVNLSGVVEGSLFLDPFCGVGGLLVEASMLGCKTLGIDAVKRMLRGSRKNLLHFKLPSIGFVRADARRLPLHHIDAIATDPPYGTGASTLKSTTRKILQTFLPEARMLFRQGNRLVFASPKDTKAIELVEDSGFKIVDTHYVYVHRRLTREILVLQAN